MRRVLAFLMLLPGCALLGKSEPLSPRYFSPERPQATTPRPSGVRGPLRLGTIRSGSDLRNNLVVRTAALELSYDEEQRWSELPEEYLRRALSRELYEVRGFRRVVGGPGPSLQVELTRFEEVVGPPHLARVTAVVILHDDRLVSLERSFNVERPIQGASPEATVDALSGALSDTAEQIADAAIEGLLLSESPPSAP
jgi:ABC-type uncharacterized transport system auxiliary subunit